MGCFNEFCLFVLLGLDVEYNPQRVSNLHNFVGCQVIYLVENVKRIFFFKIDSCDDSVHKSLTAWVPFFVGKQEGFFGDGQIAAFWSGT